MSSRWDGDLFIAGTLRVRTLVIPDGTVTNVMVNAGAAIVATKLVQRRHITVAEESTTSSSDTRYPAFSCYGTTAVLVAFEAGCVTKPDTTDVTLVDLLKNGATMLTGTVTVDTNVTNRVPVAAALDNTAIADGDLLEVDFAFTATAGTEPLGMFATIILDELPA